MSETRQEQLIDAVVTLALKAQDAPPVNVEAYATAALKIAEATAWLRSSAQPH